MKNMLHSATQMLQTCNRLRIAAVWGSKNSVISMCQCNHEIVAQTCDPSFR